MKTRKWLSLILSIAMVCSLLPLSSVGAEGEQSITSEILSINGEATTWQLLGEHPTDLVEKSGPDRLEYYDGNAMSFELVTSKSEVEAGPYKLSIQLFSGYTNISPDAQLYAVTSEGQYSTALSYSGSSWEAPATLTLPNIIVGSDGELRIGVKIVSSGEHYGYIRNVLLTEGKSASHIKVTPNSAILRPDYTIQLNAAASELGSITYHSSDEEIATVDSDGLVTAVGNGEATVTAKVVEDGEVVAEGISQIYVSDSLQTNYDEIQVEPVDALHHDLRSDFIMGADISMLDALSQVDRKFYTADGVESSLIDQLKSNGVNWIRLRSWVDPSDEHGNPYGGGNIDTASLVSMAAQVKAADLKLLVDLHYSDFWTDPARQGTPKAWASLNPAELEQQVYDYTLETLQALADADAYPDMIQIGNETNGGMLWPLGNSVEKAKPYIAKGIEAVRDFEEATGGEHIDIVIHRANPGDGINRLSTFYNTYDDLDYDVIGISYYPFWHGSLDNLQDVMDQLAARFDRKVAVVETSYAYTLEDAILNGPTGHIFSQSLEETAGYLATVQGQANAIRDVIAAVAAVPEEKGIGIFYWEPGWQMGTDTGWGTTYAADYQNEEISADGGSGWANQALFNYFGEALPSINVFEAVRASREDYTAPTVIAVDDIAITTSQDEYVAPPTKTRALFSDDTYRNVNVAEWEPSTYDYTIPGEYVLVGTLEQGGTLEARVTVRPKNYVVNPGFESSDLSAWTIVNSERSSEAKYSGSYAIHFWNEESLSVKQQISDLPNGIYQLSVQTRIGIDDGPIAESSMLYATSGNSTYSTPLEVTGWDRWKQIVVEHIEVKNGSLEIGVIVNDAVNDYGDFDDFELIYVAPLEEEPEPSTPPRPRPETSTSEPAPVLTSVTLNGIEVLQATAASNENSITLPLQELTSNTKADVVIIWGDQKIIIPREQLNGLSGDSLTISRNNSHPSLNFAGADIETSVPAVQWQVALKTAEGNQQLQLPFVWQVNLSDSLSTDSVALYTVDEHGELQYLQGVEGQGEYLLTFGQTYVIASVTRRYSDVEAQSDAVTKLTAMGIIQGDARGALNLQQAATRGEVSKLVSLFAQFNLLPATSDVEPKSFTDVASSHWAKPYIDHLTAKQWLQGVGAQAFAPNAPMSYEALYVLLARMLQLPAAEPSAEAAALGGHSWSGGSIQALLNNGAVDLEQLQSIDLTAAVTREQLFDIIYSLISH